MPSVSSTDLILMMSPLIRCSVCGAQIQTAALLYFPSDINNIFTINDALSVRVAPNISIPVSVISSSILVAM